MTQTQIDSIASTPKGRALLNFIFIDGPALGISDEWALVIGKLLIKQWDGSETLAEMFKRIRGDEEEEWPEVVGD